MVEMCHEFFWVVQADCLEIQFGLVQKAELEHDHPMIESVEQLVWAQQLALVQELHRLILVIVDTIHACLDKEEVCRRPWSSVNVHHPQLRSNRIGFLQLAQLPVYFLKSW